MKLNLHHISYAVSSTEEALKSFKPLYPAVKLKKCLEVSQNVYVTYLSKTDSDELIELVEPAGPSSPVDSFLKNKSVVLYHLCYQVENFDEGMNYFEKNGFFMITKPFRTSTDPGKWACHFFHPQTGVVEIIGEKNA